MATLFNWLLGLTERRPAVSVQHEDDDDEDDDEEEDEEWDTSLR